MRKEFYDIYRDLYKRYQRTAAREFRLRPSRARLTRLISDSIESAAHEAIPSFTVRPDAMLFLAVNFNELVAKPLLHTKAPPPKTSDDIAGIVRGDVKTILSGAARGKGQDREVSAGDVIRSVGQVYENLGVRSMDLWG